MKAVRDESTGEVSYICETCGKIYNMSSEWDRANLEWHFCWELIN